MRSVDVLLQSGPLSEEFQCDLGDKRRSERVKVNVEAMAERPDEWFPEVFDDPSALEGTYRLLRNEQSASTDCWLVTWLPPAHGRRHPRVG